MTQLIEVEKETKNQVTVSQPMHLIEMAISNNADIEKLEKLMALQERWDAQQAKKAYFDALSQMQAEMPIIRKLSTASFATKSGGNMSYAFAKLEDIVEQMKPFLKKFGFSFRFEQSFDNGIFIKCIATHKDGHSEECSMVGGADMSGNKNPLQQVASSVTYLRRYTLTGVFGISTADADIDGRLPDDTAFVGRDEVMELVAIMCDEHGQVTPKGQKLWAAVKLKDWESITEKQYKKIKQMAGVA